MVNMHWACTPSGEYPDNWDLIAVRAKHKADWRCEHCGMEFIPFSNKALYARNADGKPSILTVHHLDGNKGNCTWENLLVCCQSCHLTIQAAWQPGMELPASWRQPPEWMVKRKLPYEMSRQLYMFENGATYE